MKLAATMTRKLSVELSHIRAVQQKRGEGILPQWQNTSSIVNFALTIEQTKLLRTGNYVGSVVSKKNSTMANKSR